MSGPNNERPVYAERMFPAPVDLGIAQPDRAVSSCRYGTEPTSRATAATGTSWYEGGGTPSEQAVQGIDDLSADRRRCRPRATRSSR